MKKNKENLKICLLSYRSNPYCGGQGVYIKYLSRALTDEGHDVEVLAGNPPPLLDSDIKVRIISGLDLYNSENLGKNPKPVKLFKPVNFTEWMINSTMGYPEPLVFGLKVLRFLEKNYKNYDVIHDNQSLFYGLGRINKLIPVVSTIHHPMTRDRNIAIQSTCSLFKKAKIMRWYSFISMQKRVARKLSHIITVSECSKNDLVHDYGLRESMISSVPNGIDTSVFKPDQTVEQEDGRLIVTNSADSPLKGLFYLLHSLAILKRRGKLFKLIVIGHPKKGGKVERLVKELNLSDSIEFTGRISTEELVKQYSRASIAVVPSIYEGFGMPVGEAMACRIPVICTSGGALKEVAGDAALVVKPADSKALANAICSLLENKDERKYLADKGFARVKEEFSWKNAGRLTSDIYYNILNRGR